MSNRIKKIATGLIKSKKSSTEKPVILKSNINELQPDIDWFAENVIPGMMTWIDTLDPLLFIKFCSIHNFVDVNINRLMYTTPQEVYQWFSTGSGGIIGKGYNISQASRYSTIQTETTQCDIVKYTNEIFNSLRTANQNNVGVDAPDEDSSSSKAKNKNVKGMGTDIIVLQVSDDVTIFNQLVTRLKNIYTMVWGVSKHSDRMILPDGIPKFVFLPIMPIDVPDILRRSAIFVNFDNHVSRSLYVRKIRDLDLYTVQNNDKFKNLAFPPSLMESTVGLCPTLTDVTDLLSNSLVTSTPGLKKIENPKREDEIGGFENVKDWAREAAAFMESKEYTRDERPRNVLIVGPPGTGKSVAAKAMASMLGWTGLEIDISEMLSGLQGESERNLKTAFNTVRSIGKCIVLFDEVEKDLGGATSSSRTDGGVLLRMVKTTLQFTESDEHDAIFVMTANSVKDIPPPLMRSGRLDVIFYAGIPGDEQRRIIMEIYLRKSRFNKILENEEFMDNLIAETKGYTGAEIEALLNKVKRRIRVDKVKVKDLDVESLSERFEIAKKYISPVSESKYNDVKEIETWAKSNAINVD